MNTKAIIAIAVAVVLVAGGAVAAIALMNGGDDKDDLPSKYDQRDKGIVTPVKYQNPWGTCWSFGSTGAAETSILTLLGTTVSGYKQTYGEELDLSERHLAWFALHPVTNAETDTQIGEGYNLKYGGDYRNIFDNGGRAVMAASLYSTGVGPVKESGDDYFGYWGEGKVSAYQWFNGADEATGLANTLAYLDKVVQPNGWDDFQDYIKISEDADKTRVNDYINVRRDAGYPFAIDFNADAVAADPAGALEVFKQVTRTYMLSSCLNDDYFTEMTDWSIPATDGEGDSYRNLTAGYTLLNGNIIPHPFKIADMEKWDGLDDSVMDIMKKELRAGHGLAMSYYVDNSDGSFNKETWSQFSNNDDRIDVSNHAIQVVGWDDSYSKSNFTHTPEHDGAWLCKNSWGSETEYTTYDGRPIGKAAWGITNSEGKHTGYFWISYCDRTLRNILSYEFTQEIAKGGSFNTYVYDFLPTEREATLKSGKELMTANVFTVDGNETLKSVSVKTSMYGSDTRVCVYKLKAGFANPTDGEILYDNTLNLGCEGFHLILIDKNITFSKDDKVSVVVTEKNKEDGKDVYLADYNFGLDKENTKSTSKTAIYATTVVNPGESYIYMFDEDSGTSLWKDWYNTWNSTEVKENGRMLDNFRIKMFTVDAAA